MTLRNILVFPDPRLREVAQEVKIFDEKLKSLSEDLLETMYEFKGIGLAATQIGVPKRILVIDISEEKNEPQVFINPKIKILEERIVDESFINYTIKENDNEINVFFNNRTFDLIGWQNTDVYQNFNITFLSSIRKNRIISKNIFKIPTQN